MGSVIFIRNHLSAGLCLDLLQELTVLPTLPSWMRGTPGQGREEKRRKGEGRTE